MGVRDEKARPVSRRFASASPTLTGPARPQYVHPSMNVYDAALARMRWLFEEFDGEVAVCNSGGKDSTVVVELAAQVARENGLPPLRVMWLDQECEFQSTVDYQRYLMYERDDIDLWWYQVPFFLENATNLTDQYLHCWGPGEEWVRDKEPTSIHDNTYGEVFFYELLASINETDFRGCLLDGMRCEEAPGRRLLMLSKPAFKWATWSTWGRHDQDYRDRSKVGVWRFQPIYDWSYRDVWKAIQSNGWRYNEHYNHLFARGVPIRGMRVSNYHHDQALSSLHWLQEIEPATWDSAIKRLQGISTYGHLQASQYPTELPYMFKDWVEYLDFLIVRLIPTTEGHDTFRKQFKSLITSCPDQDVEHLALVIVKAVISGDYYGTQIKNYRVAYRSKKKAKEAAFG